ncbi:hypothetical protein B296_00031427 [Ensete ventricosum]|uniref:Uncharacterized protein n=1 Tax=Ensete ventricosum TaxID=4639 RepID=A0A427AE43_ENSVE|nr:hypothetical protein B296_00031427 [Ensete ventricosum]
MLSFCLRLQKSTVTFPLGSDSDPLKLPKWLPSQKDKRHERNIVTLQDPSDRLWPVMYHESIKFIGFANGCKDSTIANNIQQGNLCSIL